MVAGRPIGSPHPVAERSLGFVRDFQRYEYKYRIPNSAVNLIVADLHRFMALDPYSAGGRYYPLHSIYLDTADWQAYYEKMDGVERRKKFRVRTYDRNADSDAIVMVEIKEKNKDIILKRRVPTRAAEVFALSQPSNETDIDEVAREWRFSVVRDALKPVVLVSYRRLAFVPRTAGDFRVTVDTDINWGRPHSHVSFNVPIRPVAALRGSSVLEIKFGKRPPAFIQDLIRRFDLRNEAISKYCESVLAMNRNLL